MTKKFQTPSMTSTTFHPALDRSSLNGQDTFSNPSASAPTMHTVPTAPGGAMINVSDADIPPSYSDVVGKTNPPSYLPGVDKYPAQLVITKQPTYEMTYLQPPQDEQSGSSGDNFYGPFGLELFKTLTELTLSQQRVVPIAHAGHLTPNFKYTVEKSVGQVVLSATESSNGQSGRLSPFLLDLRDNRGDIVLSLSRVSGSDSCCCPCCLQRLEVSSGGALIGVLEQECSMSSTTFRVLDVSGHPVLRIESSVDSGGFDVFSSVGARLGRIMTQSWRRFGDMSSSSNYSVSFPSTMDVKLKATLLGAVFLIFSWHYGGKKIQSDDCCSGSSKKGCNELDVLQCLFYSCLICCKICEAVAR